MAPQTKELLEIIGRQIQLIRKSKNLTQVELAEKCGTTRHTIGLIEQGSQNLTLDMLVKITNALGFALDINYQAIK